MTDPIVVTALFRPQPGAFESVLAALTPAIAAVHEEEGCLLYAIHSDEDGQILMIEKWESVELLDAHGAGDAVAALKRSLHGLLVEPAIVRRLVPLPRGSVEQGAL